MANTINKISDLIENQMPDFIRSDHPGFTNFLKAYYEWMEDSNQGKVLYSTENMLDYADVDTTTEEFLTYFKSKFLPYFPEEILADKATLIKRSREFYQKKGSQESIKFLFRVLYGQDIELSYPKEQILKASDGKWYVPQAFKLTISNTSPTFDLETLKKRRAVGSETSASCIIEGAYRTIDKNSNQEVFELYVSNVNRNFTNGERLEVYYTANTGDIVYLFSEKIIGSLSKITIDPNNRGLKYVAGNPVVISGGLSTEDAQATKATAVIASVSSGQLQTILVTNGGYGFRQSPDSTITIASDTGVGASALISAIGTPTAILQVSTDIIGPFQNVVLSNSNYGFANFSPSNSNTELWRALSSENITVGPIKSVIISTPGTGYTTVPSIDASSYYTANSGIQENILNLGKIAYVEVVSGGIGYKNTSDSIAITGIGTGSNASFSFANNASGTITSVTVLEGGEGYTTTDLAISTSTGSGAVLKAYRYGEGDLLAATVDDVGRIQSFTLTNRGSGYVATPNVSLRVKDIVITTPTGLISEGDYVYQGTAPTSGNFTFYATVDSYTSSSSTLRIYDYIGNLSTSSNLRFASFNTQISSVTTYGNGQARANAEFLNGLLKSNGYFLNTDGFLSADKKLQDSDKYHNFSYVVIAEKALETYRQALLDILHPSGMKLIGYNQLTNSEETAVKTTSNVYTSNTSNSSGTIDISTYGYTGDANVKMLLHFSGPDGSNNIIDSVGNFTINIANNGPNLVTQNSTTKYSTAFGNTAYFPPTSTLGFLNYAGSYLRVNNMIAVCNVANNSWCLEGWFYSNDGTNRTNDIFYYGNADGSGNYIYMNYSGGTNKTINILGSGGAASIKTDYLPNTWYHIALVHDYVSKRFRIYANGVFQRESSSYISSSELPVTGNLYIGGDINVVAQQNFFTGYMDEITFRYGTVGYSANTTAGSETYTEPTAPFADYQFASLIANSVVGIGTTFTRAKANDLIVIDTTNSLRTQVKRITSVANDSTLFIEGSTSFVGDGRLTINSATNVITITGNTNQLSMVVGDFISYNVSATSNVAKVTNITGNQITLNATPLSSNTNVVYVVNPIYNDVSFKIISTD
jgi:hypothetical protein